MNRGVVYVGGGTVVAVGVYGLLWVAFADARIAAIVLLTVGGAFAFMLAGMWVNYRANRAIIDRLTAALLSRAPVAPEPPAQALPEPAAWERTGPNALTRSDRVDALAAAVERDLSEAGLPPTLANIKEAGAPYGVRGNGMASVLYERFVRNGWTD